MAKTINLTPYSGPSGGWGSVISLGRILRQEKVVPLAQLWRQNKADGFSCVSCAWGKPAKTHPFEFCENGAKATAWELTPFKVTAAFFDEHSVTELQRWTDYDLEQAGRLTEPLRYDAASDRYLPVTWEQAFADIGEHLRSFDPKKTVFYASGRASLETSYAYALFARMYGHNNLPDSSNMCHESTSVGLKSAIGAPVGTVTLEDFEKADAAFFFGQNVGSNSPRMLHDLQRMRRRNVPIVTFNPLRERGLERFTNPQSPVQMLTRSETTISTDYFQVRAGGDIAAILGICKSLIEHDEETLAAGRPAILDHDFLRDHTHGFEAFRNMAVGASWETIETESGLLREQLERAAEVYGAANAVIGIYGMGLTQHKHGVDNVYMLVNLMLLRGNIGKPGAGLCPVRGHSNVQGQRTVGITEKPELAPLDVLAKQYGFEPPRDKGMNTIEVCEAIVDRKISAFIGLGGNFVRAVPDTAAIEQAWRDIPLTVQIATKLNRSHLVNGRVAYLLPCLGRTEQDRQRSGLQSVSIEDSNSCIHGSKGTAVPAAETLLAEMRIVAELAKATLAPNPKLNWDSWVDDYSSVRAAIEDTYPEPFKDYEKRMWNAGGFHRPNPARQRQWKTKSGRAEFNLPTSLNAAGFISGNGVYRLMTLRSNDQFNTTIYGYSDRFRGIEGTRNVLFMNRDDIAEAGLNEGQEVSLHSTHQDGLKRAVSGLTIHAYNIPRGCLGGYYPECNVLIPVSHHAEESKVPAAKSVPVRIVTSI